MKNKQRPEKPSIKGHIIGLLACVPFLLFGAALIKVSVDEISYTSTCSAQTEGKVTEVSSRKVKRIGRKGKKTVYTAHYSYVINDEEFTAVLESTKKVKEGQTLTVRYRPDDPKHKYVKGYDNTGNFLPMIVGIVWDGLFLLIAAAIVTSIFRRKSPKDKKDDNRT